MVPVGERKQVWQEFHQALGHVRGRRLIGALKERVFWPGLTCDVEQWQKACPECLVGGPGRGESVPLGAIPASYPWEILAVDFLSLGRPMDSYPYLLTAIDVFSLQCRRETKRQRRQLRS